MTPKSNTKFGEESTSRFKIDKKNLTNFDLSTWKSQKLSFELKNTEELSFMTLKSDTKFGQESTCRLKIDIRNLTNFDLRTYKSQNFLL